MCRRFTLSRDTHDGVNQPGTVAEGIVFGSGKVALCWIQPPHAIINYDSLADVLLVQKQNGITRVNWLDAREERPRPETEGIPSLDRAKVFLADMLGSGHVLVSAESSRSTRMEFARNTVSETLVPSKVN